MASYSCCTFLGNVTRDIELKYTQGGTAVADIGLAVNDRRKSQSGEWEDEVSFFDCTAFGRTAEVASEYLSKGSPVFLETRPKLDQWEKDGEKRSKVKFIVNKLQLIGGSGGGNGGGQQTQRQTATAGAGGGSTSYDDPDIPFAPCK